MTQKKTFIYVCVLFLTMNVSTSAKAQEQKDNRFEISKNLDIFNAIVKEVEMFYVDTIDVEKMVNRGINAMLRGLDPYTEYIPEQDMGDLKFMTTGEYGGIGSIIQKRKEGVIIAEPFEGMPAALAGLKAGDIILSVDTVNVKNASNEKVSSLLKGVPNTKITLMIQRHGEKKPLKVELVRKQILVDQVTYYGVRQDGIGYIHLKGFTDKSTKEVRDAFLDLKKNHNIKALILDLRNNGGGLLESAAQIVNMFVPKGKEVVSTKGKIQQSDRTYRTLSEPIDTIIPLAVLINESSASAAEIVSGALQDMDRAVIVGQRSFGKGLVQSPRELPYNGNLKVTTSKYFFPSGRCIQRLDYTHRSVDGNVGEIPDSLISVFYTKNGRPVHDGAGIRPDFEIKPEKIPTIMYYLATDFMLFDFITEWAQKHEKIAPIEDFKVSDEDFEAFKKHAKEKNFTYDRQSEKALKTLKEVAEFEGYLDGDSTILKALQEKLTPDLNRDFDRFKKEIKKLMASEIVKRYYYQKGELIESLKDDEVMEKSIEILSDIDSYKKILTIAPEK
jgi:C-terminal peptidase (prc)